MHGVLAVVFDFVLWGATHDFSGSCAAALVSLGRLAHVWAGVAVMLGVYVCEWAPVADCGWSGVPLVAATVAAGMRGKFRC